MVTPRPAGAMLERIGGLHDPMRLRLLALLNDHELAVGELAAAVQAPQSTVSRHLKRLLASGWINRRSQGPQTLYRHSGTNLEPEAWRLWEAVTAGLCEDPTHEEDLRRVREILASRKVDSRAFFGSLGGDWSDLRGQLFGRTILDAWLPVMLDPDLVIADLGCGTGQITATLCPFVGHVHAIYREPAMLKAAQTRLSDANNVSFHEAYLHETPLPNGSVDVAILSLVLHHLPDPGLTIEAAARVLKDDGRLILLDMIRHDRTDYRDTMGHLHLGFEEAEVTSWCQQAGLKTVQWHPLRPDPEAAGPSLFAATASRKKG